MTFSHQHLSGSPVEKDGRNIESNIQNQTLFHKSPNPHKKQVFRDIEFNAYPNSATTTVKNEDAIAAKKTTANGGKEAAKTVPEVQLELTKLKLKHAIAKQNETENKFKVAQNRIERLCRMLGEVEKEKELQRLKYEEEKDDRERTVLLEAKRIEEEVNDVAQERIKMLEEEVRQLQEEARRRLELQEREDEAKLQDAEAKRLKFNALEDEVLRLRHREQEEARNRQHLLEIESKRQQEEANQQHEELQHKEVQLGKVANEQQRQLHHIEYLETDLQSKSKQIQLLQEHIKKEQERKRQEEEEKSNDCVDDINGFNNDDDIYCAQERDVMILDMVVHLEDLHLQMYEILDLHQSFEEITEIWRQNAVEQITVADEYKIKWLQDEIRKKKTVSEVSRSIQDLQEEIAMLLLKSKDLYKYHQGSKLEKTEMRQRESQQQRSRNRATTDTTATTPSPPSVAMKSVVPIQTFVPNQSGILSPQLSSASSPAVVTPRPNASGMSLCDKTAASASPLASDESYRGRDCMSPWQQRQHSITTHVSATGKSLSSLVGRRRRASRQLLPFTTEEQSSSNNRVDSIRDQLISFRLQHHESRRVLQKDPSLRPPSSLHIPGEVNQELPNKKLTSVNGEYPRKGFPSRRASTGLPAIEPRNLKLLSPADVSSQGVNAAIPAGDCDYLEERMIPKQKNKIKRCDLIRQFRCSTLSSRSEVVAHTSSRPKRPSSWTSGDCIVLEEEENFSDDDLEDQNDVAAVVDDDDLEEEVDDDEYDVQHIMLRQSLHRELIRQSIMSFRGRLSTQYYDCDYNSKPWVQNPSLNPAARKSRNNRNNKLLLTKLQEGEKSRPGNNRLYGATHEKDIGDEEPMTLPTSRTRPQQECSTLGDLSYLRCMEANGECRNRESLGELSLIVEENDEFRVSTTPGLLSSTAMSLILEDEEEEEESDHVKSERVEI